MKRKIRYPIISVILVLLASSCASVVNSTGSLNLDTKIENLKIYCTTPENVSQFSTELCVNLEASLMKYGIQTSVIILNELFPVLDSDSTKNRNLDSPQFIMKIDHVRVSLYGGKPCNTLMNISLAKNEMSKPIWEARIYTKGSNVTGPGNPIKVSEEILDKMNIDGLIKLNK